MAAVATLPKHRRHIRWFEELGLGELPLVGGKNASLGELYHELAPKGVAIPNGFAVTADGFRDFFRTTGLDDKTRTILAGLAADDVAHLQTRGRALRLAILAAEVPDSLREAIGGAYRQLDEGTTESIDVAVRSSATAEDLPDASFAGHGNRPGARRRRAARGSHCGERGVAPTRLAARPAASGTEQCHGLGEVHLSKRRERLRRGYLRARHEAGPGARVRSFQSVNTSGTPQVCASCRLQAHDVGSREPRHHQRIV